MKTFLACFFGVGVGLVVFSLATPRITPSPSAPEPDRSLMSLKVPDDYEPCRKAPDVIRRMAFSLDTEPTAWTTDGYRAHRVGGGAMWVANNAYGIEIGPEKRKLRSLNDESAQRCLWQAFTRWAVNPVHYR